MILADEYSPRDQRETPYGGHVSHKDNTQGLIKHTNCGSVQNIFSMDTIPSPDTYPDTPDLHIKESTAKSTPCLTLRTPFH